MYPLEGTINLSADEKSELQAEAVSGWVSAGINGFYAFFDKDRSFQVAFTVVPAVRAVPAFAELMDAVDNQIMEFGARKTFRANYLRQLVEQNRVHPITIQALNSAGAWHFCWLHAGEELSAGADQKWVPTESGGFLYVMQKDLQQVVEEADQEEYKNYCFYYCTVSLAQQKKNREKERRAARLSRQLQQAELEFAGPDAPKESAESKHLAYTRLLYWSCKFNYSEYANELMWRNYDPLKENDFGWRLRGNALHAAGGDDTRACTLGPQGPQSARTPSGLAARVGGWSAPSSSLATSPRNSVACVLSLLGVCCSLKPWCVAAASAESDLFTTVMSNVSARLGKDDHICDSVHWVDDAGNTPLHCICRRNDEHVAMELLVTIMHRNDAARVAFWASGVPPLHALAIGRDSCSSQKCARDGRGGQWAGCPLP